MDRLSALKMFYSYTILALAVAFTFFSADANSQETLFPPGYNIVPIFYLSSANFSVLDTVTVIRVLLNNESFSLQNLYLVDNLPNEFTLVDYSLLINDEAVPVVVSGPVEGEMYAGHKTYRWIIDSPNFWEPVNHLMGPGEFLELTYRFVANSPGSFQLPFHSLCFYGNGTGFFTTSGVISVEVTAPPCNYVIGDANSSGTVNGLDVVYMVNFFKGGRSPEVSCYCPPQGALFAACDINGNCSFNGVDVTYLLNYLKSIGRPLFFCPGCPPAR